MCPSLTQEESWRESQAFCGEICTECVTFQATRTDDNLERRRIAGQWSSPELPLQPEDINCTGCRADQGPPFKWCLQCEIRACGSERAVENCAYCDNFGCQTLQRAWEHAQTAKARANLQEIRRNLRE